MTTTNINHQKATYTMWKQRKETVGGKSVRVGQRQRYKPAVPALQNLCTEGQTRRRKINRSRRRKGILQVRTAARDEWVQPVAWIEWVNASHHTFRYMAQDIH